VNGPAGAGEAIVEQADGRIVVASPTSGDFRLTRYLSDGTLDPGFGVGGLVTTPVGPGLDFSQGLTVQSDGKVVAVGAAYNASGSNSDFAVVRYNTDGTLDLSFGTGGMLVMPIGAFHDTAWDVVQQPDGKLVVSGDSNDLVGSIFKSRVTLVRYASDGSLDATFGSGGVVRTAIGTGNAQARALALQPDGKLIVGGAASLGELVARYNVDGSLDATFGAGGIAAGLIDGTIDSVALQPDGRIVANSRYLTFRVLRFDINGALDSVFGSGGVVATPSGNSYAVVLQPDGKMVAGGLEAGFFKLVRYNLDGTIDPTFGVSGAVTTPSGGLVAMLLDSAGRFVACGYSGTTQRLARYHTEFESTTTTTTSSTSTSTTSSSTSSTTTSSSSTSTTSTASSTSSSTTSTSESSTTSSSTTTSTSTIATTTSTTSTTTSTTSTTSTTLPPACASAPATGCRLGLPLKSSLQLVDATNDLEDQWKWKWKRGEASSVPDFKDPVGASPALRVCLYDGSANSQPLLQAVILAGGTCGTKPCWKLLGSPTSPKGYKFKSKAGTPNGVIAAKLKAGIQDKAQVEVKAKGIDVPLPALPLSLPVTVQLLIGDGDGTNCWQSTFSVPIRNDAQQFKAKGP
jgi:uncharacterized delta-60 repeat protein